MLQHEITPFASAHRLELDKVLDLLRAVDSSFDGPVIGINRDDVQEAIRKLETTKRGINRFEACALDEWRQKERLQSIARTHRLNCK